MLYDACSYNIYMHIMEYLHDVIFVKLYFRNFLQTKSGVVMGRVLTEFGKPGKKDFWKSQGKSWNFEKSSKVMEKSIFVKLYFRNFLQTKSGVVMGRVLTEFGKPGKKDFWKSQGKSWNFEKSSKVMEKSWNLEKLTPINHPPALEI